jgi:hypothetical protein
MLPSPTNSHDETHAGFGSLNQKSAACDTTVLPASLNCNLLLHISCMTFTLMSFHTINSHLRIYAVLRLRFALPYVCSVSLFGTFAKLRKPTVSVVIYVCLLASLSARSSSAATWHIVMQFCTGLFFGIYIYIYANSSFIKIRQK